FADIVMRAYGSEEPARITGDFRFGDTRHILSDITSLQELGWSPRRRPADSVAAYATWLETLNGLDGILDAANGQMRALGVIRRSRRHTATPQEAGHPDRR
ncbi:MAG TPA: hypothetical protein VF221_20160, partial [Chloroflexota bacterium]